MNDKNRASPAGDKLAKVRDLCAEVGELLGEESRGKDREKSGGEDEQGCEALRKASEALRLSESAFGISHYATGFALCALALAQVSLCQVGSGSTLARAEKLASALEPDDFENAAAILTRTAALWRQRGFEAHAQSLHARLLSWHAVHLGQDHPRYHQLKAELEATVGKI